MPFDHVNMKPLPELVEDTRPTGRTYETPEGNKYPSITTVLRVLSRDGIERWKNRVGQDEAKRVLTQAGRRGTSVHQIAEDYLNNKPDWKKGVMPVNLHSFMQLKPILDENVNNIWAQEVPLYSDKFKIAGRVDCIAEWQNEIAIIDFKTARKKKKREWIENYFIQTAFYAAAFFERTGVSIKKGVILITPDGNEPQVFVTSTHDYLTRLLKTRKEYRRQFGI